MKFALFDLLCGEFGCVLIGPKKKRYEEPYKPTSKLPGECLCTEFREMIQKNTFVLCHDMEPDDVILHLYSEGHMTERVRADLRACATRIEKNEKILEFVLSKTNQVYIEFLRILTETNQDHLARLFATHPHVVITHRALDSEALSDKSLADLSDQIVRNLFMQVIHLQENGHDASDQLMQAIRLTEAMKKRNIRLLSAEKGSTILTFFCEDEESLRALEEFVSSGELKKLLEESLADGKQQPSAAKVPLNINIHEDEFIMCRKYFESSKRGSNPGLSYHPSPEELKNTPGLQIPLLDKHLEAYQAKRRNLSESSSSGHFQ